MYGAESALIYDTQHEMRGKDYAREAADVAAAILERCPAATSVLDLACGTGGHLRHFVRRFPDAAGLERSESMLDLARAALPGVALELGDMRDFDLGRRFDAVTCLFASIGYVTGETELASVLRCVAGHLAPGGVAAIEPWWTPETFIDRHVSGDVIDVAGTLISRLTHTTRDGDASRMEVHYGVAHRDSGVRHFTEVHRASLFTHEQYATAFERAGLPAEYLPGLQCGRGLYVGIRG